MDETRDSGEDGDGRRWRRPAGWTYGLPALALLWVLTSLHVAPEIEHEIRRAALRLSAGSADPAGQAGSLERRGARAEVDGRDVTIVADLGLGEDLMASFGAALRAIPGVRAVRTESAVSVAMAPFVFTARRSPEGLSLAGGVARGEERAALVTLAGTIVPTDAVDDRLRLGTGAPPGFAEASRFVLAALAKAEQGEATVTDLAIRISAVTRDPASYEATLAALRSPPSGFRLEAVEIEPPVVSPYLWSASREERGLAFAGFVPSEALRARVAAEAGTALPGVSVRDEMRTAGGLDSAIDFEALARAAISALAELESGTAELRDRTFRLSGRGVDKSRLPEAEARLRAALPSGVEAGPISVVAVPASPFRVLAKRAGGRLVLTGFVPGERERRDVAAIVASRYPGETLTDRRVVADGAPAGFQDAQRAALEALANFAEGEAAIRDKDLRISGRMLYAQAAVRTREAFPRAVPAGWSAEMTVAPVPPEGALDVMACGDLLADSSRRDPVAFASGKPDLSPQGRTALDRLADIVRRCGAVQIAVTHQPTGERSAEGQALASARAAALITALRERGATARLSVESAPAAAGSAERTTFAVLP